MSIKKTKVLHGPVHHNNTESRISYLESLVRNYQHTQQLEEAYQSGIKDGKSVSFWPTFIFGVVYGVVLVFIVSGKKSVAGNPIGFKPA